MSLKLNINQATELLNLTQDKQLISAEHFLDILSSFSLELYVEVSVIEEVLREFLGSLKEELTEDKSSLDKLAVKRTEYLELDDELSEEAISVADSDIEDLEQILLNKESQVGIIQYNLSMLHTFGLIKVDDSNELSLKKSFAQGEILINQCILYSFDTENIHSGISPSKKSCTIDINLELKVSDLLFDKGSILKLSSKLETGSCFFSKAEFNYTDESQLASIGVKREDTLLKTICILTRALCYANTQSIGKLDNLGKAVKPNFKQISEFLAANRFHSESDNNGLSESSIRNNISEASNRLEISEFMKAEDADTAS